MQSLFSYTARSLTGENVVGDIRANSEAQARVLLRAQNFSPIDVRPKYGRSSRLPFELFSEKIDVLSVSFFLSHLAPLIRSGMAPGPATRILSGATGSPGWQNILNQLIANFEQGDSLSGAFSKHPRVFDEYLVGAIKAAETTGSVAATLEALAEDMRVRAEISAENTHAIQYPAALLFFIVLTFALWKWPTGLSNFVTSASQKNAVIFVLSIVTIGFLSFQMFRSLLETVRLPWRSQFWMDLPFIGDLLQKLFITIWARRIYIGLTAGLPLTEAVRLAAQNASEPWVRLAMTRLQAVLNSGTGGVASDTALPHLVTQYIGVHEQTGQISSALHSVADFFADAVKAELAQWRRRLDPFLFFLFGAALVLVLLNQMPISLQVIFWNHLQ